MRSSVDSHHQEASEVLELLLDQDDTCVEVVIIAISVNPTLPV